MNGSNLKSKKRTRNNMILNTLLKFLPRHSRSINGQVCMQSTTNVLSKQELLADRPTVLRKYKPFKDEQSPVILDVDEERKRMHDRSLVEEDEEIEGIFTGISDKPGVNGVIEIDELIDILARENAQDIFVARVPEEFRYVQHMVIVSGKSSRHLVGMADFVRRVYKYKVKSIGPIPMLEGKNSKDWVAIDLGNIALHFFSKKKREEYDLESLWSVGSDHDRLAQQSFDEPSPFSAYELEKIPFDPRTPD